MLLHTRGVTRAFGGGPICMDASPFASECIDSLFVGVATSVESGMRLLNDTGGDAPRRCTTIHAAVDPTSHGWRARDSRRPAARTPRGDGSRVRSDGGSNSITLTIPDAPGGIPDDGGVAARTSILSRFGRPCRRSCRQSLREQTRWRWVVDRGHARERLIDRWGTLEVEALLFFGQLGSQGTHD